MRVLTSGDCLESDDAYALEQAGKRAVYLSIENGYPIGSDIANVEMFFDKGVRYITLVHSTNNDLADSSTDSNGPEHNGVSEFGASHSGDESTWHYGGRVTCDDDVFFDALEVSKTPVLDALQCSDGDGPQKEHDGRNAETAC